MRSLPAPRPGAPDAGWQISTRRARSMTRSAFEESDKAREQAGRERKRKLAASASWPRARAGRERELAASASWPRARAGRERKRARPASASRPRALNRPVLRWIGRRAGASAPHAWRLAHRVSSWRGLPVTAVAAVPAPPMRASPPADGLLRPPAAHALCLLPPWAACARAALQCAERPDAASGGSARRRARCDVRERCSAPALRGSCCCCGSAGRSRPRAALAGRSASGSASLG